MAEIKITTVKRFKGETHLPGDKSISHRAVMIGSIASGKTEINNFLLSGDCLSTVNAFRSLGIEISTGTVPNSLTVSGRGLRGLTEPRTKLDLGNSGTTMRLILGILAGQDLKVELTGDASLRRRPMKRVTEPLRLMGAEIKGRDDADHAPLVIKGGRLKAIQYTTKVASAQVKSAILLAGLYCAGITAVTEPAKSRDHTERMLQLFGAELRVEGLTAEIRGEPDLRAQKVDIPGDISSAAFFLAAAAAKKGSRVTLRDIGLNPTRTGLLDVLLAMGAKVKISNQHETSSEPRGDITVRGSDLKAVCIEEHEVPKVIDELPVIMAIAPYCHGRTVIKGASELRVKETDRINSMATNLNKFGARIEVRGDDVYIDGDTGLKGAEVSSFADHRTAMAMVIAGLLAEGQTVIKDTECINVSFPGFMEALEKLLG